MRIIICGDRKWQDEFPIRNILAGLPKDSVIIHGGAKGADDIAGRIAAEMGFPVIKCPARWHQYGRAAGPIRNEEMLTVHKPDRVIAFHNNLEESKGTRHMVGIARAAAIPVWVLSFGKEWEIL